MKPYILALNHKQAEHCARNLLKIECSWIYVYSIQQLFGLRNAQVYLYGDWMDAWGDDFPSVLTRLELIKDFNEVTFINEWGAKWSVN